MYLEPYQTCLSGFYCKCVSVFCFCFCFSFFSFSANETVYSRFGLLYSVRLVSYQTSFSTMLWRNQGQKRSFADVLQNRCSLKFGKFHSKTPLLESLFNKSCRPGFFEDFWLYWCSSHFTNYLQNLQNSQWWSIIVIKLLRNLAGTCKLPGNTYNVYYAKEKLFV